MKMYYVANFYMPYEKRTVYRLPRCARRWSRKGTDLTLVVPTRGPQTSLKRVLWLAGRYTDALAPRRDLAEYDRFGYFCIIALVQHFVRSPRFKLLTGERFAVYPRSMHGPLRLILSAFVRSATVFQKCMVPKVRTVCLATPLLASVRHRALSTDHREDLKKRYQLATLPDRTALIAMFAPRDKWRARVKLGLPYSVPVYCMRADLWWKGLEIIPRAATPFLEEICWRMVGDTREKFISMVQEPLPTNMHFAGEVAYAHAAMDRCRRRSTGALVPSATSNHTGGHLR